MTTRLLVGCGVAAGGLALTAGAAAAEKPAAKPAKATAAPVAVSASSTSTTVIPAATTTVKAAALPVQGPIIVTRPPSPGTDLTPTWSFIDPDGDAMTCTLLYGGVAVQGPAPCGGSASYNLVGDPYGTYTFRVATADATATSTYTLVPVAPTITAEPTSPGTDTTPTWSFSLPAGTSGRCSLLLGGATVAGPTTCTGSQTFTVTTDGTYTFRVTAVADGTTSAAATSTYTLDAVGPAAPTITSGPAALSSDDTPTWTFTTGAGTASTECTLRRGSTVLFGPAPCTGSAAYDLTLEPDGTYTFSVTAFDAAGNPSAATTSSYTLQRIAPAPTPSITGSPTSPGTDTTPTWTFTTPAGTTTECTLFRGSVVVAGPVACSGSFTPSALTIDGTYTFQVVAIDTVTGARSEAATSTYTLDTTPPGTPVFTSTPPAGGSDRRPEWEFTMPSGAVALECTLRRGTTVIVGPTNCSSGSFTENLNNDGEGTYTLSVVAIDALGNRSAAATSTYTLDRTAPTAPTITSGPSGLTTSSTLTYTFTAPAGATTTCTLTGPSTNLTGPCSGSATYSLASRPDGTYTFSVTATDAVGNTSVAATRTVTVDRTAPAAPTITSGPSGTSTDRTPEWKFSSPGDVTTICSVLRGSVVVIGPTPCSSPAAFDLSGLPLGTYTFSVVAVDQAGNTSPAATRSYTMSAGSTAPPNPRPNQGPPAPGPAPAPLPPPAPAPTPTPAPVAPTPTPRAPTPTPRPGPGTPGGPAVPGPRDVIPPLRQPTDPPSGIIESAGRVVEEAAEGAAFPLLLVVLVVLFLIIQNRIDRRDPKLAQAPVHAGDELEFRPPPSRRGT